MGHREDVKSPHSRDNCATCGKPRRFVVRTGRFSHVCRKQDKMTYTLLKGEGEMFKADGSKWKSGEFSY